MVGAALGRLWDTHPKVAFVCHLCLTVFLGGAASVFVISGRGGWVVLILAVAFLVMAAVLVFFTWLAIQDHWRPDVSSDSAVPRQLPSLRVAWGSAQTRERVLWTVFVAVFLVGLVLGMAKNVVGLAFIFLAIALVFVAVRARR
ncbi:MAG TPA: hypothetical protein VIJ58_07735 [Candidatus Dormibacteraeota bacterium]